MSVFEMCKMLADTVIQLFKLQAFDVALHSVSESDDGAAVALFSYKNGDGTKIKTVRITIEEVSV